MREVVEVVVRLLLEVLFELIFYGIAYWTGWVLLMVLSAGRLNLGQYETWGLSALHIREIFTIWRDGEKGVRELKAEVISAVGVVFLLVLIIGLAVFLQSGS